MDQEREFRFVAEKVYSIPGKGVVVTGRVEAGLVSVGDEVGFLGMDGKYVAALVIAIEVSRRLVEVAEAGNEASLLLQGVKKERITTGAIFTALPEAPSLPVVSSPTSVTPSPSEAVPRVAPSPPPVPYSARPIHPSSTFGRTAFFIVIGILILLLLLFYQGKWDPKKWDPRRKLASIQNSAISFQQSANRIHPM